MAPRIRTDVQVMFFDTDCGGVVSNIAYLRFIETARTHLAEELGLAIVEMAQICNVGYNTATIGVEKHYLHVCANTGGHG